MGETGYERVMGHISCREQVPEEQGILRDWEDTKLSEDKCLLTVVTKDV